MFAEVAILPHFMAEICGTAAFMFIGCAGYGQVFEVISNGVRSFTIGAGLQFALEVFGSVSSGHFNPAVSLGIVVLGKMEFHHFLLFITAQYFGALFGYALLIQFIPFDTRGADFCLVDLPKNASQFKAFALEVLITAAFVMATASLWDSRNLRGRSSPMRLGLLYGGLNMVLMPYTGGGLNPARAFIPQLVTKQMDEVWLYQFGPYIGGTLGAAIYRAFFDSTENYSLYSLLNYF